MITIDILSALFAFAAGLLWLKSAIVETPKSFAIYVVKPTGNLGQPLGGNPIGGEYMGHAYSQDLNNLANALIAQSKTSGYAAFCACAAALLQAMSITIHAIIL